MPREDKERTLMNNALDGIDITPEGVVKARSDGPRLTPHNGICVCGHTANSHTENVPAGYSKAHDHAKATRKHICTPSRHKCPCREYKEVLTADKVNKFRRTTTGPAEEHALIRGLVHAMDDGVEIRWAPGLACVKCHTPKTEVALAPVAYDLFWFEAKHPTDMNVMICKNCRDTIEYEWAGIAENQRPDKSSL